MCNTLRTFGAENYRFRRAFLMERTKAAAAADRLAQTGRQIVDAEAERIHGPAAALTPISPSAAAAEAYRS